MAGRGLGPAKLGDAEGEGMVVVTRREDRARSATGLFDYDAADQDALYQAFQRGEPLEYVGPIDEGGQVTQGSLWVTMMEAPLTGTVSLAGAKKPD